MDKILIFALRIQNWVKVITIEQLVNFFVSILFFSCTGITNWDHCYLVGDQKTHIKIIVSVVTVSSVILIGAMICCFMRWRAKKRSKPKTNGKKLIATLMMLYNDQATRFDLNVEFEMDMFI